MRQSEPETALDMLRQALSELNAEKMCGAAEGSISSHYKHRYATVASQHSQHKQEESKGTAAAAAQTRNLDSGTAYGNDKGKTSVSKNNNAAAAAQSSSQGASATKTTSGATQHRLSSAKYGGGVAKTIAPPTLSPMNRSSKAIASGLHRSS